LVHRLMTIVLLRAVRRVWVAIPAWERRWQPYTLGRAVEFRWLPVGSSIPVAEAPNESLRIRARFVNDDGLLIGHFGSYDANTTDLLLKSVPELMKQEGTKLLLLGHGSSSMRSVLTEQYSVLADRVHATGSLSAAELSHHISACDLMLQPYIDGVSSRRTSTMTALAHGVPVVTTNGKFTESIWAASGAVVMVDVENCRDFAKVATRLLQDVEVRMQMSAAARRLYTAYFDRTRTIASLRAEPVAMPSALGKGQHLTGEISILDQVVEVIR
ncbi:MAG TPA: glycosyltransferase, partial [Pyrinomonadaceae bacterium]|nr:glycosyltransferase [Pyrinomonadaceae bacterium]